MLTVMSFTMGVSTAGFAASPWTWRTVTPSYGCGSAYRPSPAGRNPASRMMFPNSPGGTAFTKMISLPASLCFATSAIRANNRRGLSSHTCRHPHTSRFARVLVLVAAFAALSRSISGNSVAINPASFTYDSTAERCFLPPPTGLDLCPMKMMRSSGWITTSGSGHRPKPFARMSSSGIVVRMIPMRTVSLNSFAVSPNVLPTHAPYRRFGPLRRFLARRRRMDFPSKSSMLSKMRLKPGCAAQMNMSELRNRDRSIGMMASSPLACVKHAASTYALALDICITTRSSGWTSAAPLYGLVKST